MPAHLLRDLSVSGSNDGLALEPDLDLYRADRVRGLQVDVGTEVRVVLDLLYDGKHAYNLRLVFEGVRELVLPTIRPLLSLPELEIEDVRNSLLEGIRYQVVSQFDRGFRCACHDVTIELRPLEA